MAAERADQIGQYDKVNVWETRDRVQVVQAMTVVYNREFVLEDLSHCMLPVN